MNIIERIAITRKEVEYLEFDNNNKLVTENTYYHVPSNNMNQLSMVTDNNHDDTKKDK